MKEYEEMLIQYHRDEILYRKTQLSNRCPHRRHPLSKAAVLFCVHLIRMHRGEVLHLLDDHRQKLAGRDG